MAMARRSVYAVVGLGNIAGNSILPAFRHCKKSKLVAVVSSDPKKAAQMREKSGAAISYSRMIMLGAWRILRFPPCILRLRQAHMKSSPFAPQKRESTCSAKSRWRLRLSSPAAWSSPAGAMACC